MERRRREAVPEKLPPLPQPKPTRKHRQLVDRDRVINRHRRTEHWRAGICSYVKCRGENCPGGRT